MTQTILTPVPFCDPLTVFQAVRDRPFALLLDSATAGPGRDPDLLGRWTFVAADPFRTLVARGARVEVDGTAREGDPFAVLEAELEGITGGDIHRGGTDLVARADRVARMDGVHQPLPPFRGGAAGYFGYELAHHLERLPRTADDLGLPEMAIGLYDSLVAFDVTAGRAFVVSTGLPERGAAREERAADRAAGWRAILDDLPPEPPPARLARPVRLTSNFTRAEYERAVARVVDYVLAGDIFQANLSQRLTAQHGNSVDAFALYRRLRAVSPAPFAGFLDFGDGALLSSSPEQFLSVRGRQVQTKPIKGTRPRGRTPEADAELATELLASEKDRAENVMIVDLLRNDLSRVAEPGSVTVPALCALESFATVHHLVSTVCATLRPGRGPVDLLRATFPGGSITGAPKIRAMEVIAQLEGVVRGPYCGALGYIGFDGSMDTNILIRSISVVGERAVFNVGGGVIARSDPADEYDETVAKARGMVAALGAEGMWP